MTNTTMPRTKTPDPDDAHQESNPEQEPKGRERMAASSHTVEGRQAVACEKRAAAIAQLADAVGHQCACDLTGLQPGELADYLKLHEQANTSDPALVRPPEDRAPSAGAMP